MQLSENEIQRFINNNTFFCKNLSASISGESCNLNQHKSGVVQSMFFKNIGFEKVYCKNCKTGKKYFKPKKEGDRVQRQKECLIHKIIPEKCKSREIDGIMLEDLTLIPWSFDRKKYCCRECAVLSTYQKYKDMIKRVKNKKEFPNVKV